MFVPVAAAVDTPFIIYKTSLMHISSEDPLEIGVYGHFPYSKKA